MISNETNDNNLPLKDVLCNYARRMFRRQADFDYIAARSNYRLGLPQQFLWSSEQAVEKYLKAILLFNGCSARYSDINNKKSEFSHKLDKILSSVKSIKDLGFSLPLQDESFITYLTDQGCNRYLTKQSYTRIDALERLDSVVWHIRRYCQSFEANPSTPIEKHLRIKSSNVKTAINPELEKMPHLFKLRNGEGDELEQILKKKSNDPARRALVWANRFYGSKKRKYVKYKVFSSIEASPNELASEYFDLKKIEDYIKL